MPWTIVRAEECDRNNEPNLATTVDTEDTEVHSEEKQGLTSVPTVSSVVESLIRPRVLRRAMTAA
jgi:hypothetical protein